MVGGDFSGSIGGRDRQIHIVIGLGGEYVALGIGDRSDIPNSVVGRLNGITLGIGDGSPSTAGIIAKGGTLSVGILFIGLGIVVVPSILPMIANKLETAAFQMKRG